MLHISVCDDDHVICAQVEEIILSLSNITYNEIEVEVFYTVEDLSRFIASGASIDILFLDIEFQKSSGIDIGMKIREEFKNEATQIVYISGNESYAMKLFKIRPLDFLIKPIQSAEIEDVVRRALELVEKGNQFFEFKSRGTHVRIPFKNILYFESEGRKIRIIVQDGVREFYGKLSTIEKQLFGKDFFQIHKSFLVNYYHIAEYQYESIRLTNEEVLMISQQNRKFVSNWLLQRRRRKPQIEHI